LKAQRLHVYSDSQVVVKQMTGEYQCRSALLYSCTGPAGSWLGRWIFHFARGREMNAEANTLALAAVRKRSQ